jgi:hypothetical protein
MVWAGTLKWWTQRLACTAAALAFFAAPAASEDTLQLPASAKRLNAAAIVALYDGKTFAFKSVTDFGIATGEVSYDFKTNTNHGTYQLGPHHGTFSGAIRVSGDKFCYKARGGDICNYVYIDGADVYEVKQSGFVDSVKHVLPPTPPA